MNISFLDSIVQKNIIPQKDNFAQRRQTDIAASIGNAKTQQLQKQQIVQQINQTLQQRQNNSSTKPISQPAKNSDYTFSIYV